MKANGFRVVIENGPGYISSKHFVLTGRGTKAAVEKRTIEAATAGYGDCGWRVAQVRPVAHEGDDKAESFNHGYGHLALRP